MEKEIITLQSGVISTKIYETGSRLRTAHISEETRMELQSIYYCRDKKEKTLKYCWAFSRA